MAMFAISRYHIGKKERIDTMAGRVEGKVAFITGIARGQGRAHAVRLAEEGADIIGIDLCEQMPGVEYPMATEADLKEQVALGEGLDLRIIARKAVTRVDPVDIANAVLWLCSEESRYYTGNAMRLDAGA